MGTCRCFPFLLDVVCFFVFLFYRLVLFILIFLWLASIFYRSVLPFFPRLSLKRISRFTIPPSRAVSHRLPMPQTSIGSTSKVEEVRCRAFVLFGVQWKHPKMDGFIWFPSSVQLLESRGLFSDMLGSGSVKQSVQEIKWYEKRCFPYIMLCYIADHRIFIQNCFVLIHAICSMPIEHQLHWLLHDKTWCFFKAQSTAVV